MKTKLLLLLAIALCTACPKHVDSTPVTGGDDEQLDQIASKLEELRARAAASEGLDPCKQSSEACDLSRRACEISARQPDREDMQGRCVASQEDCARFTDLCSRK
jgi:hypothetical protein